MHKDIKIIKKYFLTFIVFFMLSIFILSVDSTNSSDEYNNELKITVTNFDQTNFQPGGLGGGFNLLPISIDDIYKLMSISLIVEIIPIVNKINYNFTGVFPRDDLPDDFNVTRPSGMGDRLNMDFDNRMQEKADFIIEGMPLNLQYSSNYILSNLDIKEGNNLDMNDSSVIIIGENASEYFKTELGGNITIEGVNFTVKGIIENSEFSNYIFMNITDAQIVCGLNQEEVNTLYIYIDDSSYLDDVSTEIGKLFPTFRTRYIGQQTDFPFDRYLDDNLKNNGEIINGTPGFELYLILSGVIFLFIFYKKGGKYEK